MSRTTYSFWHQEINKFLTAIQPFLLHIGKDVNLHNRINRSNMNNDKIFVIESDSNADDRPKPSIFWKTGRD